MTQTLMLEFFDIDTSKFQLISLVGAGGKTTTMFSIAEESKKLERRVLVTTTTAIYYPRKEQCDNVIVGSFDIDSIKNLEKGTITVLGKGVSDEGKLIGINKEKIDEIYRYKLFDTILVEADGSKRKSIKAPANYEPVIPDCTKKVIGIIGLDSIGMEINENNVHRPKLFCSVTGENIGDIIDINTIASLIISSDGLFKGLKNNTKKYLILNKADDLSLQNNAYKIINKIKKEKFKLNSAVIASYYNKIFMRVE